MYKRIKQALQRYDDAKLFVAFGVYVSALYLPLIRWGGLIYDDWSAASGARVCPGFIDTYKCFFWGNYSDRPLAALYLSVLSSLFHDRAAAYYIFVIACWLAGVILLYIIFKRQFGKIFAVPFLFIAAVPSISSTVIFSPAMQGMGAFTFLLWCGSFYLLDSYLRQPKVRKLSASFILIFCVMTLYESSLPLFGLSLVWPFLVGPRPSKPTRTYWWQYLKKFVLPILGILVIVLAYQKLFIVHFGHDFSKFRVGSKSAMVDFGLRVFVNEFYIFTLGLFNFTGRGLVRLLRNNSLLTIANLLFASAAALWAIIYNVYEERAKKSRLRVPVRFQILAAVLIILGIAAIHYVATSPPTIVGYLNRGLVSGTILIALIFAALWRQIASKKFWVGFLWAIFFVGYIASFVVQRNNYIAGNRERNNIKQHVIPKVNAVHQDSMFVLAEVPTYLSSNFDNETVFSDEVLDWGNFLHNEASNSTTGGISLSTGRVQRGELVVTPNGLQVMKSIDVELPRLWYYNVSQDKLVKIESTDQLKRIIKNIKLDPTAYPLPVDAKLRNSVRSWLVSY